MIAYVLIGLKDGDENKVLETLKQHKEIIDGHILFGEWDMIVKVDVGSSEALSLFVMEHIRNVEGVNLTSTLIVAK